MNDQTDTQLLRTYAECHSDFAFAELVRRHIDLVYSAALRMVCDSHLAQDVTQGVFVALAQHALQLTDRPVLVSWLHRTAQNIAAQTVRTDVRRRAREQEAAVMNELLSTSPDASWEHIAPHLDEALGELNEPDREAVLLRYFKNHDLRTVGATLGVSDDAAQKRVSRAVERLREFFAKRGVTVGAGGLAVVISANAVQAAPVGLALTISTAAALTGTTLATTATVTATKAIAMTALQKTIVAATIAVLAGAGIYEARQASQLRDQVQTLQLQQAPLVEQIEQLQRERDDSARQLAALREGNERLNRNTAELLRLRSEASRLKSDSQELAKLKAGVATDPTESAAKVWLKRMDMLKQQLKQTPEAEIPELRFLSERDWLDVAKNFDLLDEKEYRQAFSQLRSAAERKVANTLQTAMKKFSDANNGVVTGDLSLLKDYLASPLEDSILHRYVVYPGEALQSIRLGGDWLITLNAPIDPEFDMRLVIGPRGIGSVAFSKTELVDVLAPAIKAYVAANGGKMPNDAAQIASFATTPEQQAALRKAVELIKAERK